MAIQRKLESEPIGCKAIPSDGERMTAFVLGAFFSLCGVVAFRYGKKNVNVRAMVIGGLLLVYPYFISDAIWMTAIGVCLLVALFVRR